MGGYYGAGTKELWVGDDGNAHRAGFMGGIAAPDINVNLPGLKKLVVVADAQTGNNVYGAAGGGVYFYFNDLVDILTGPVYFLDRAAQPGGDRWLWTVQLDVDVTIRGRRRLRQSRRAPRLRPHKVVENELESLRALGKAISQTSTRDRKRE